jgi:hypothetical protein
MVEPYYMVVRGKKHERQAQFIGPPPDNVIVLLPITLSEVEDEQFLCEPQIR